MKTFNILETLDWSCTLCLIPCFAQDNDGEIDGYADFRFGDDRMVKMLQSFLKNNSKV